MNIKLTCAIHVTIVLSFSCSSGCSAEPETTAAAPKPSSTSRADDVEHNGGVGMALGLNEQTKHFQILKVIPGTSAAKAGVTAGDTIAEVEGVAADGLTIDELVSKIRGKLGTSVKMTILHEEKKRELTLVRAAILATTTNIEYIPSEKAPKTKDGTNQPKSNN